MDPKSIARVIAIIDMTLSVLSTLGLSIHIFIVAFNNDDVRAGVRGRSNPAGDEATVFTLAGVFCVLKMCASWSLIKGTNDIVNIHKGLLYCRIWRGITIFFVALHLGMCVHWIAGKAAIAPVPVMIIIIFLTIFHSISIGYLQQYIYQLYRRAVIVDIPIITP